MPTTTRPPRQVPSTHAHDHLTTTRRPLGTWSTTRAHALVITAADLVHQLTTW